MPAPTLAASRGAVQGDWCFECGRRDQVGTGAGIRLDPCTLDRAAFLVLVGHADELGQLPPQISARLDPPQEARTSTLTGYRSHANAFHQLAMTTSRHGCTPPRTGRDERHIA